MVNSEKGLLKDVDVYARFLAFSFLDLMKGFATYFWRTARCAAKWMGIIADAADARELRRRVRGFKSTNIAFSVGPCGLVKRFVPVIGCSATEFCFRVFRLFAELFLGRSGVLLGAY